MLMSADNKPQTVVLTPKIQIKSHSCNIDDAHITLTLD